MQIAKRALVFLLTLLLLAACGDDSSTDDGQSRVESYLRSDTHTRLVLEVDYVDGYGPRSDVEPKLIETLEPLVDKPDGLDIERDQTITSRGEEHQWTFDELDSLAAEHDTLSVGDNTAKIHVLFVDGYYEDNNDVLGLAWANKNIVMFKKRLNDACERPLVGDGLCQFAERAVWTHEVGHVLGLVNAGVSPQSDHQDEEHGRHCDDDGCVMHWSYEGTSVFDVLSDRLGNDNNTLNFDAACREDLRVVREGD
jgi:predicted Zn-dependent protease